MGPQAVQPLPAGRLQQQGRRARSDALDRDALVWVLSALSQYFRLPFDEKLVTGQLSPPYDLESVARAAESQGVRAGWRALPASRLKKCTAPFVVLLAPVLSEPHQYGPGVARERLASLAPEAPVQRLAFLLRIDEGRVAFIEQGGHHNHGATMGGQACITVLRCFRRVSESVLELRESFSSRATMWLMVEGAREK